MISSSPQSSSPSQIATTPHRHFKMYKPPKVLSQFVFTHRKRRRRTLLGDVVVAAMRGGDEGGGDPNQADLTPADSSLPESVMAVGRLDEDSEGLLLLTTDGKFSEWARRKDVEKEYWSQVDGEITEAALERLRRGVEIRRPSSEREKRIGDENSKGGTMSYTTLPCGVLRLETEVVEVKNVVANNKEQQSEREDSSRRKKFGGTCNTCGEAGHKSRDCDRNPADSSKRKGGDDATDTTPSISLPPGLLPSKYSLRDESRHGPSSWISLTLREGKNRQVRRMTAAVGHPTLRLVRVRIGSVTLDGMEPGEVRVLDASEAMQFGEAAD